MPENKSHRGNYKGTGAMKAENQDMEFVNDTIQEGNDKHAFKHQDKKKADNKKI
ncbi:MAG: hypothetical protein K0R57_3026 [Paenibacillaceae bacterium]|jgi:uncharacterized lipoprotein YajG|nr:hypothetical protein [Paenibacillaceae bacterium]